MKSYLTNNEIEELAEELIHKFFGRQQRYPDYVDIDCLAAGFLNLKVEYWNFAGKDADKEGFISDGLTRIMVYHNGLREMIFPKGTIVLALELKKPAENNHRRFTLSHEVGHYLVSRTANLASLRRVYDGTLACTSEELSGMFSIKEAQIDRLAAALLMPNFLMAQIVKEYAAGKPVFIYGNHLLTLEDKMLVSRMADAMQVSYTAFLIRLKQLNLYTAFNAEDYLSKEMGLIDEEGRRPLC